MKQSKILVISLIIIAAIVIGIIWLLNHAPSGMQEGIITIRPGMNLHQSAYYLKSKNVIDNKGKIYYKEGNHSRGFYHV